MNKARPTASLNSYGTRLRTAIIKLAHQAWAAVRSLSGDDAYDRYLDHLKRHHPDTEPLDRRSFFVSEQQRRWNGGANRCC